MASVSVSTLIIFIASIIVAASVAGTMTAGVSQLGDALDDRSVDVAGEIRTDVTIISDPGSGAIYDDGTETVTLLVKNTGSRTLSTDPDTLDVIIDGEYRTDVDTAVVSGEADWQPGATIEVTVRNTPLELDASHRAVVVVNDDRESLDFRASN